MSHVLSRRTVCLSAGLTAGATFVGCASSSLSSDEALYKNDQLLPSAPGEPYTGSDEQPIRTQERMFMAMMDADAESLRSTLTEDATLTHITGQIQTRDEWVQSVADKTMSYSNIEVISARVERSDNGAQLVARTRTTANINGSDGTWNIQLVSQIHPDGTHFTKTVASLWS